MPGFIGSLTQHFILFYNNYSSIPPHPCTLYLLIQDTSALCFTTSPGILHWASRYTCLHWSKRQTRDARVSGHQNSGADWPYPTQVNRLGEERESTQPTNNADSSSSDSPEDSEDESDDSDRAWAPFGTKPKRVRRVITSSDSETDDDLTVDNIAGMARLQHYVGVTVAKLFADGIVYRGKVIRVVWVDDVGEHMLRVRYTDMDIEDMSETDVIKLSK